MAWLEARGLDDVPFLWEPDRRHMEQLFDAALDGFHADVLEGEWDRGGLRLAYASVAYLGDFDWASATPVQTERLTFLALVLERLSGAVHYWSELWEPEDHPLMKLPWVRRLWDPNCCVLPTEQELRRLAVPCTAQEPEMSPQTFALCAKPSSTPKAFSSSLLSPF